MRGVASNVSPSTGFRFVCYCTDCQAFARFLDRADVLDPAGGTDIFHMPPARVKLTAGTDAMRCLRLSNKVLRWLALVLAGAASQEITSTAPRRRDGPGNQRRLLQRGLLLPAHGERGVQRRQGFTPAPARDVPLAPA
jgi:hypothetical protein